MNPEFIKKYAALLLGYCLEAKEGQKLFVSSTFLAEPLLKEIHAEASRRGVWVEYDLSFEGRQSTFWENASDSVLRQEPYFYTLAMEQFDLFLSIRAPYDLYEDMHADPAKKKLRIDATRRAHDLFFSRTADKQLVRSLCQWPTLASANSAGMTLDEYSEFVAHACKLDQDDPAEAWREVRRMQQRIVDKLNTCDQIRYVNARTDISFSVKGRKWINSDGRSNMPSGEVFTGPVEDSVEGYVHFDYPSVYGGKDVQGVTLEVSAGEVKQWDAVVGKEVLDQVFSIEGAKRFGEVAIGTNYQIQRATRNILFDEKIGGSIHMAVGQSYVQTGFNKSPIHWDMIADMRHGGRIYADGVCIYEDGVFIEEKLTN